MGTGLLGDLPEAFQKDIILLIQPRINTISFYLNFSVHTISITLPFL